MSSTSSAAVSAIRRPPQRAGIASALRPLDIARADIGRLTQGGVRSLDERVPGEIEPLVGEINRLLGLLDQRLRRSRNAIGNLAHAIKGPLTELSHLTDTPNDNGADHPDAEVRVQVEAIRAMIDRELKRARLAGEGSPGAVFELRSELPILMETVRRLYPDKDLKFDFRVPPDRPDRPYAADREDMLELIGNLLDNACKWASRTVQVTVTGAPGLELLIEDDGPGVRENALEHLVQRGVRVDESTAGHGLGLAIARDIVDQYRGSLAFGRSDCLGGLRARVYLPPADADGGPNLRCQ